ncbi:DUF2556 family protein [Pantoea sp. 1.19]|uniref:DUF2556 family protein n=1 Tax=Pantoea sp. 1.19 TaxID=1925589 RepID=UPI000948CE33|nr:DUF2556 family protein [Pantoea sp. 1.19]
MIRKYTWIVALVIAALLMDIGIMYLIEILTNDSEKCRNMASHNPLDLVDCAHIRQRELM